MSEAARELVRAIAQGNPDAEARLRERLKDEFGISSAEGMGPEARARMRRALDEGDPLLLYAAARLYDEAEARFAFIAADDDNRLQAEWRLNDLALGGSEEARLLFRALTGREPQPRWELSAGAATGSRVARTPLGDFAVVREEAVGFGFTEYMLGEAFAAGMWESGRALAGLAGEARRILERAWETQRHTNTGPERFGSFRWVTYADCPHTDAAGQPLPAFLIFRSDDGRSVVLDWNRRGLPAEYAQYLTALYGFVVANKAFDHTADRFYADTIRPGGDLSTREHSSALRFMEKAGRVVTAERPKPCASCLKCVVECNEMTAMMHFDGEKWQATVGSESHTCTNCNLCTLRCPFHELVPADALEPAAGPAAAAAASSQNAGGVAAQSEPEPLAESYRNLVLSGPAAREWLDLLEGQIRRSGHLTRRGPNQTEEQAGSDQAPAAVGTWRVHARIERVHQAPALAEDLPPELRAALLAGGPAATGAVAGSVPGAAPDATPAAPLAVTQYELSLQNDVLPYRRPLLFTALRQGDEVTLIINRQTTTAVLLTAPTGEVDLEMAARAELAGTRVLAVADRRRGVRATAPAARPFARRGLLEARRKLETVIKDGRRTVDYVLAAELHRVPVAVQEEMQKRGGDRSRVMAPTLLQGFFPTQEPLKKDLQDALVRLFLGRPVLQEALAAQMQEWVQEYDRYGPHLYQAVRTMTTAQAGTACAGCPEFQLLNNPIYSALIASLSRGEMPDINFSIETGCMSETLLKADTARNSGGITPKWPGGRTLFGGGFAFAEAVAEVKELAIQNGYMPPGRRYVISQGGDGGSYIGLPALLNALRQRAYQIRTQHNHVLHWIQITDTQGYSNTGGEASLSVPVGTGAKTTPIGRLLIGMQRVQTNLINWAGEFPGIMVGIGHSANPDAATRFYLKADALGRSAIRWDFTPCEENIGMPVGIDPNEYARVWQLVGLAPEIEFVGRFRKRVAPINPHDREKDPRTWTARDLKPIEYLLRYDRRFAAYFDKSGNLVDDPAVRLQVAQLERYRDYTNWWIDLESRIAWEAEMAAESFFAEVAADPRYAHLFDPATGRLKAEYGPELQREFLESMIGHDFIQEYEVIRSRLSGTAARAIREFEDGVADLKDLGERVARGEASREQFEEAEAGLWARFEQAWAALGKLLDEEAQAREQVQQLTPFAALQEAEQSEAYPSQEAARQAFFRRTLDRILMDRARGKLGMLDRQLKQHRLEKDFLARGGVINERTFIQDAQGGAEFRARIARLGGFIPRVTSISGDRGITINRILYSLGLRKGAWPEMMPLFKSSKRGEETTSGAHLSARRIDRKDWLREERNLLASIPSYEEVKGSLGAFLRNLDPRGVIVVNTPRPPAEVRAQILSLYDDDIQAIIRRAAAVADLTQAREQVAQERFGRPWERLSAEEQAQATQLLAAGRAHIVTADLDGIRDRVGLGKSPSNLLALGPLLHALNYFGLPFDLKADKELLLAVFQEIVKKPDLAFRYYMGATSAYKESQGAPPPEGFPFERPLEPEKYQEGPGGYLIAKNGGELTGRVLSQLGDEDLPVVYFGYPITPSGDVFSALAKLKAEGHPYIWAVDENVPMEKVNFEKLLGAAKAGMILTLNATASQGYLHGAEAIPFAVGNRLPWVIVVTGRAKSAPWLNIEGSQEDFLTFTKDGAMLLVPSSVQEVIYALYLARLVAPILRLPVIVYEGGITDTHRQTIARVPTDAEVRAFFRQVFADFDYNRHTLTNEQGELLFTGASAPNETYLESRAMTEAAWEAVRRVFPQLVDRLAELTGYRYDPVEFYPHFKQEAAGPQRRARTVLALMGTHAPTARLAVEELRQEGFTDLGLIRPRIFTFTPDEEMARILRHVGAETVVAMDQAGDPTRTPPLAKEIESLHSRFLADRPLTVRAFRYAEGGRDTTVSEFKRILKESHLLLARPGDGDPALAAAERAAIAELLESPDHPTGAELRRMLDEMAAQIQLSTDRNTFAPAGLRPEAAAEREAERTALRQELEGMLRQRAYAPFLARYGRVEFAEIKEYRGLSDLARRAVRTLEAYLAERFLAAVPQHPEVALEHPERTLRLAAVLLEYGPGPERTDALAAHTLRALIAAAPAHLAQQAYRLATGSADYQRRIAAALGGSVPEPGTPLRAEAGTAAAGAAAGAGPSADPASAEAGWAEEGPLEAPLTPRRVPALALPQVPFSPAEAAALARDLAAVLAEPAPGDRPRNPVDLEFQVLARAARRPDSPLHGVDVYNRRQRGLVAAYRRTYGEAFLPVLARQVLTRDFAPHLAELESPAGRAERRRVLQGLLTLAAATATTGTPAAATTNAAAGDVSAADRAAAPAAAAATAAAVKAAAAAAVAGYREFLTAGRIARWVRETPIHAADWYQAALTLGWESQWQEEARALATAAQDAQTAPANPDSATQATQATQDAPATQTDLDPALARRRLFALVAECGWEENQEQAEARFASGLQTILHGEDPRPSFQLAPLFDPQADEDQAFLDWLAAGNREALQAALDRESRRREAQAREADGRRFARHVARHYRLAPTARPDAGNGPAPVTVPTPGPGTPADTAPAPVSDPVAAAALAAAAHAAADLTGSDNLSAARRALKARPLPRLRLYRRERTDLRPWAEFALDGIGLVEGTLLSPAARQVRMESLHETLAQGGKITHRLDLQLFILESLVTDQGHAAIAAALQGRVEPAVTGARDLDEWVRLTAALRDRIRHWGRYTAAYAALDARRELRTLTDLFTLVVGRVRTSTGPVADPAALLAAMAREGFPIAADGSAALAVPLVAAAGSESESEQNAVRNRPAAAPAAATLDVDLAVETPSGDPATDLGTAAVDANAIALATAEALADEVDLFHNPQPVPRRGGGQMIARYLAGQVLAGLSAEELAAATPQKLLAAVHNLRRGTRNLILSGLRGHLEYGFHDRAAFEAYVLEELRVGLRCLRQPAIRTEPDLAWAVRVTLLRRLSGGEPPDTAALRNPTWVLTALAEAGVNPGTLEATPLQRLEAEVLAALTGSEVAENGPRAATATDAASTDAPGAQDPAMGQAAAEAVQAAYLEACAQAAASGADLPRPELTVADLRNLARWLLPDPGARREEARRQARRSLPEAWLREQAAALATAVPVSDPLALRAIAKRTVTQILRGRTLEQAVRESDLPTLKAQVEAQLAAYRIDPAALPPGGLDELILTVLLPSGQREGAELRAVADEIMPLLAQQNCYLCGKPTCRAYADALVTGYDPTVNLCVPAGKATMEKVIAILRQHDLLGSGSRDPHALTAEEAARLAPYTTLEGRLALQAAPPPPSPAAAAAAFREQVASQAGAAAWQAVTPAEREWLQEHGEHALAERWREAGEKVDWLQKLVEPRLAGEWFRRSAAAYRVESHYPAGLTMADLSAADQERLTLQRLATARERLGRRPQEPVATRTDLLQHLTHQLLAELELPQPQAVLAALGNPLPAAAAALQAELDQRAAAHRSRRNREETAAGQAAADQTAILALMDRALRLSTALRPPFHPDDYAHRLAQEAVQAVRGQVAAGCTFRFTELPAAAQAELESDGDLSADRLTGFKGASAGLLWAEMEPPLQAALLRALAQERVQSALTRLDQAMALRRSLQQPLTRISDLSLLLDLVAAGVDVTALPAATERYTPALLAADSAGAPAPLALVAGADATEVLLQLANGTVRLSRELVNAYLHTWAGRRAAARMRARLLGRPDPALPTPSARAAATAANPGAEGARPTTPAGSALAELDALLTAHLPVPDRHAAIHNALERHGLDLDALEPLTGIPYLSDLREAAWNAYLTRRTQRLVRGRMRYTEAELAGAAGRIGTIWSRLSDKERAQAAAYLAGEPAVTARWVDAPLLAREAVAELETAVRFHVLTAPPEQRTAATLLAELQRYNWDGLDLTPLVERELGAANRHVGQKAEIVMQHLALVLGDADVELKRIESQLKAGFQPLDQPRLALLHEARLALLKRQVFAELPRYLGAAIRQAQIESLEQRLVESLAARMAPEEAGEFSDPTEPIDPLVALAAAARIAAGHPGPSGGPGGDGGPGSGLEGRIAEVKERMERLEKRLAMELDGGFAPVRVRVVPRPPAGQAEAGTSPFVACWGSRTMRVASDLSPAEAAALEQVRKWLRRHGPEGAQTAPITVVEEWVHAGEWAPGGGLLLNRAALADPQLAVDLVVDHLLTHQFLAGLPLDSRIPARLRPVAEELAAIWHTLERVRPRAETVQAALAQATGHGLDPDGTAADLIGWYASRTDHREEDVAAQILAHLFRHPELYGELLDGPLAWFADQRHADRVAYESALRGLIAWAEGALGALPALRAAAMSHPPLAPVQGAEEAAAAIATLDAFLERLRAGSPAGSGSPAATETPAVPDRAGLWLLAAFPVAGVPHHGRFVRFLIEDEAAEKALLAGREFGAKALDAALQEQIDRYNQMHRLDGQQVAYTEGGRRLLAHAFSARPPLVEWAVARELRQTIYRQLAPAEGRRRALNEVIRTVTGILGHLTEPAMAEISRLLDQPRAAIKESILSYERVSADPQKRFVYYNCIGLPCLIGRSRDIEANLRDQLLLNGIADMEIKEAACFGRCNLAPVGKLEMPGGRSVLLGRMNEEKVAELVQIVGQAPEKANLMDFFHYWRATLGQAADAAYAHQAPVTAAWGPAPDEAVGQTPGITPDGRILSYETGREWGRLAERAVAVNLTIPQGPEGVAVLVLDRWDRVQAAVGCPEHESFRAAVGTAAAPRVQVRGREVWLEGDAEPLGLINSQTIAVQGRDGSYFGLTLAGTDRHAPPESDLLKAADEGLEEDEAFLSQQDRVLLALAGKLQAPWDLEEYEAHGGYQAVRRVLGLGGRGAVPGGQAAPDGQQPGERWTPQRIVDEIKAANLRGRGGAGFPAGVKMQVVLDAPGEEKYVVVNLDEGDPGAFIDRSIAEELPHQLIEGTLLTALAVGARHGFLYIRSEYEDAWVTIERAVGEARRRGYLGRDIFGQAGLDFDLTVVHGGGSFEAGERRAILSSTEGGPAAPDLKLGTLDTLERGLWGKPQVTHNAKSLAFLPIIINKGARWFRDLAYFVDEKGEKHPLATGGTFAYSVSGAVQRTGRVEIRVGRTIREIISICGGPAPGKVIRGVQFGGPSGSFLNFGGKGRFVLDAPLDFDLFKKLGIIHGSGGAVFLEEGADLLTIAYEWTRWLERESCGKCGCERGTASIAATLQTLLAGRGTADHVLAIREQARITTAASLCGLGMTAANPAVTTLQNFPVDYLHLILRNGELDRPGLFRALAALRLAREEIQSEGDAVVAAVTLTPEDWTFIAAEMARIDPYLPAPLQQMKRLRSLLGLPAGDLAAPVTERVVLAEAAPALR